MNNNYIVIMAGGSGTRLWPVSRAELPKQFQHFSDKPESLIQETYERIKDLVPQENIYVSLIESIAAMAKEQLPDIDANNFIVEPEGKNTAPAMGLIASVILKRNPEAIVTTVASDHSIGNVPLFQESINHAFEFVKDNPENLVTIGIKPTEPNTGFGYIKIGEKFDSQDIYKVDKFVEKPNLETAQKYLDSGEYMWNASYFTWNAMQMLENFNSLAPNIYEGLVKISDAVDTENFPVVLRDEYAKFAKEPIETVIIEKMASVAVIPADLNWSDIGTWSSLYEFLVKSTGKNTISHGDHVGVDDENCLFYSQSKLLATIGLKDIIIVDTPDVTLVCNKNKSQDIKKLMDELREKGREKYL